MLAGGGSDGTRRRSRMVHWFEELKRPWVETPFRFRISEENHSREWSKADLVGCKEARLHLWLCPKTTVFWTDRSEDRQPSVMQEFHYKAGKVKSQISNLRMLADLFSNLLSPVVYHSFAHLRVPNGHHRNLVVRRVQNRFSPERQESFSAGGEKK